jgi:hypothetical protein
MNVLDQLLGTLDGPTLARMARQLGASPEQTQNAVQAALPLLLGALQRNASTPEGAASLHRAVVRDHQGVDLGQLLGGLLGGSASSGGGGLLGAVLGAMGGGPAPTATSPSGLDLGQAILKHVLGGAQPRAAGGIARASGLDPGRAQQLLAMLAPMIMAALGRSTQQNKLDAGGLAALLGREVQRFGATGGASGSLVNSLLDADGDGDVDASDLMQRGAQLFALFGRR